VQVRAAPGSRTEAWPDLIERARHDRAAFGELYDLYVNRVFALCLTLARDRNEAEDLTSQTFERALKNIRQYESRGVPMSSWLFRIAANLATDRARKKGKVVNLGNDPIPEDGHDAPRMLSPEEQVVQWERARYLRELLDALPEDQRRALRLRYFESRNVAEIADAIGRNENATKQLLHRAMENLRRRMRGEALSDV
jgi:RNA polymerase sigma-70 factor, ECF subfamily